jgi:hypothetical protein
MGFQNIIICLLQLKFKTALNLTLSFRGTVPFEYTPFKMQNTLKAPNKNCRQNLGIPQVVSEACFKIITLSYLGLIYFF